MTFDESAPFCSILKSDKKVRKELIDEKVVTKGATPCNVTPPPPHPQMETIN